MTGKDLFEGTVPRGHSVCRDVPGGQIDQETESGMTMKKTIRRVAAAALAAAWMLLLLAGCGAQNDVKKTISAFESSCRALDVRGMLECINPTISSPILSAMDLFGVEDTSGTLELLTDALDVFGDAGQEAGELIQSIRIKPSSYVFNEAKDQCTVTAELSYGDGDSAIITLRMILKDGSWYIADLDF